MKKINLIFLFSILIGFSCDDGDFVVTSFDFSEANLQSCETGQGFVFYKINNDSFESISLSVNALSVIFEQSDTVNYTLDQNSNIVHYRKYSATIPNEYFCATVPPTSPEVTSEFVGNQGTATFTITAVRDDQDGIDEPENNQLDTDQDGLPDYYDFDDDGDNVPTLIELGEAYLSGNSENPQDTDGDGIPDYLDEDDDNDGVLTRYEDANGDLDPTNDITNGEIDYLTPTTANANAIDLYREHSYTLTSSVELLLNDIVLSNNTEEIIKQTLVMGVIENFIDREERITPAF